MEWLINRRRMMYYKKVPPVYMNFEDQRIWEICCYRWGETYDLQEVDEYGNPMVYTVEGNVDITPLTPNTYINKSNGAEAAYNGWSSSDFVDVSNYNAIKSSISLDYCAFYNSSKVFVSAVTVRTEERAIPKGVTYIRISGSNTNMNRVVLTSVTQHVKEGTGVGGVLDSGELEGNNDTLVYSDYMFAATYAISAHGLVHAAAARIVPYRVEIVVEGGRALDGEHAPWDIATASATSNVIFYPVQYNTTMSATALGTITAENWADPTFWASQTILTDGGAVGANAHKYTALITTTTACQYLRLGIRAVAGTSISWKFVSVGVTKLPQGITQAQCAAVSYIGTASAPLLKTCNSPKFNEFKYFTGITTLPDWEAHHFSQVKFPPAITTITYYNTTWSHLPVMDFPSTVTTLLSGFWLNLDGDGKILILRSATPPSVSSNYMTAANLNKIATIYIPTEYMETYKAHAAWGNATLVAKMQPLEGSKYEVFNEWEYD